MPNDRHFSVWVTLSGAAAIIDVSKDTILRRAVPWQDEPVRHRIRYKSLLLDEGTLQERRYVTPDGMCLRVWRAKGQDIVNPFCAVHEGLRALLDIHRLWLKDRYPNCPWFFPGRTGDQVVDKNALSHALRRLKEKGLITRKLTPHGGRAFFVTFRRSQGGTDNQIALEIGHTSGGSTLSAVYGGVPPDWIRGGGPKMAWLPSGAPAWSDLLLALQKVSLEATSGPHQNASMCNL